MFEPPSPRHSLALALVMAMFVAGMVASGLFLSQAGKGEDSFRLVGFVAALFGGWLTLVLARRLLSQTRQTISKLVSEATPSSSPIPRLEKRTSLADRRQEARESELALLQMTLGPRVY